MSASAPSVTSQLVLRVERDRAAARLAAGARPRRRAVAFARGHA
jgi:hypothetical protein